MVSCEIRYNKQAGMTKERLKYLLDRFLENKATEEELKEYADWYEKTGAQGPDMLDTPITKEYTNHLYKRIIGDIDEKESHEKRTRRLVFMRWAVAASLVLIAGAFLIYNKSNVSKPESIAEAKAILPDSLRIKNTDFENIDNKNRRISLDDGSVVDLFPGSKLACEFSEGRRDLRLTGKGLFNVAKDSSRPFTVYSGHISTTALGTSFTVNAYPASNNIEVALYTGKVVVRQIKQTDQKKMDDVYLLPGHSLNYNIQTGLVTLKPLKTQTGDELSRRPAYGSRTGYEASFNQELLSNVLDEMAKEYGVPIKYNKEELSEMYFSGNIRKTDSLSRVLKRIALLHNLRINITAIGYSIKKDH